MTLNHIVIRCPNSDPTFMRLAVLESLGTLIIERGRMENHRFISQGNIERIPLDDIDMTGLYQDDAWDIEKLYALADFYCMEESDAARPKAQAANGD